MDTPGMQQASTWIKKSENILLLTHKKMDGDGLASTIALHMILKKLHKNVTAVCEDPVPDVYKFLPTTDIILPQLANIKDFIISIHCPDCEIDNLRYSVEEDRVNIIISPKTGELSAKNISFRKGLNKYDLIIVLDTPDLESLGSIYDNNVDLFFNVPVINIDHHITNTYFGKINLVDITASSTAEIILYLSQHISKELLIDEDIATLLLAGIIVDTASFQNPNATPASFAAASQLVSLGAKQQDIIKNIYKTKKLTTLKLWGKVLNNVKNDPIYRLVWSSLHYTDMQQYTSNKDDIIGIIDDLLANAPGAEIMLSFIENIPDTVHIYIKTINPSIDASKIAALCSGTGSYHDGLCIIQTSLGEAEKQMLEKLRPLQASRLGITQQDHYLTSQIIAPSSSPHSPMPHVPQDIPKITVPHIEDSIGNSLVTQLKQDKPKTVLKKKK